MSVKLYNLSGLPDEPLRTLLVKAKRLAGCGGSVIVKVTRGGYRVTSCAKHCAWVAKFHLSARRFVKGSGSAATFSGKLRKGHIRTSGGYVTMQPYHPPAWALRHESWKAEAKNPINWAKRFFETAIHEFHHIREFHEMDRGKALAWSKRVNGRRPEHDSRPEELRAYNATDEALERAKRSQAAIDELILQLAVQMDAKWGVRP